MRQAVERGDFADLPGMGRPLELDDAHDPDWWVKRLVERERITVLPPAIALRREDAALDDVLDRLGSTTEVRREVTEFNERVRRVLYTTHGGPPVTTSRRDVEEEVRRWVARRDERRARQRAQQAARQAAQQAAQQAAEQPAAGRRRTRGRWFRRPGRSGPSHG